MSSASSLSGSPPPDEQGSRPYGPAVRSRRQNVNYGNYGMRNQLMAQLNRRELYGLDVYRFEDDDISLRHAAAHARLPYDRMTLRELQIFTEMAKSQASINLFLYLRNRILVLWQLDPLVELTVTAIQREIPEPYNSDFELVHGIHNYLQRYGYINFGVFLRLSNRQLDHQYTVVVIGAGAAGLAAARQLTFLGFNVVVLEARSRACGRVMTIRPRPDVLPATPADAGGMIITGIIGNPLVTLIQQNACNIVRMSHNCPIYDPHGKMVDARKDDMIQKSFNRILSTISYIVHGKGITEIDDNGGQQQGNDADGDGKKATPKPRKISLGAAFDLILDQHELRVQTRRLNYWKKHEKLCNKLKGAVDRVKICRNAINECMERLRHHGIANLAEATPEMFAINFDDTTPEEEFNRKFSLRCLRKCLQMAVKEYEQADQERREIDQVLNDFKNMEPSHVFMNNVDKRILDFHLANLEYGIGAPLSSVALKDWDQDDPYGFAGSHITVKEGLGSVIERLCTDLKIELNCVVTAIQYNEKGVTVKYMKRAESKPTTPSGGIPPEKADLTAQSATIKADAVLCTIPLGVLKKTPFLSEEDKNESGPIQFEPQLPAWKREAIGRLGFGQLNKLILFFEKPFWDTNKSSFGRLNDTPSSRGELFLFYSNGDLPMLIGLFAGDVATITSQLGDTVIVQKAMAALHRIYGSNCPNAPSDYFISRWHIDPFSRGCYSYMSASSMAEDYDLLARPLHPNDNEAALPRVFFAGEHTNRQYPSSVHGAFLSGLREAARIADTFIGELSFGGEDAKTMEADDEFMLVSECQDQLNILDREAAAGPSGSQQQKESKSGSKEEQQGEEEKKMERNGTENGL